MLLDRPDRPAHARGSESDFDHRTDRALRQGQFEEWDRVREACPAFVNRSSGPSPVWFLLGYAEVRDAFQDPETFSSRSVEAFETAEMIAAKKPWIPVEVDPPLHTSYRRLVSPFFTPAAARAREGEIRELCVQLIEKLEPRGAADILGDFAKQFPTIIFMRIMGLPTEDADQFLEWVDVMMHTSPTDDPDYRIRHGVRNEVFSYLGRLVASRRAAPRDDLVTSLVQARFDDGSGIERALDDEELLRICFLLYLAGLDTVAASIGYLFHHFATTPEDRAALVRGDIAADDAVEELLRTRSIVNTGRLVTRDVEHAGCPMSAGDRVVLVTAAANRDPAEFEAADQVVFGRRPNRHIAFGAGPHRCLGSHLARLELRVALEEWHARIPDYRIADGATVIDRPGSVSSLISLPLTW